MCSNTRVVYTLSSEYQINFHSWFKRLENTIIPYILLVPGKLHYTLNIHLNKSFCHEFNQLLRLTLKDTKAVNVVVSGYWLVWLLSYYVWMLTSIAYIFPTRRVTNFKNSVSVSQPNGITSGLVQRRF